MAVVPSLPHLPFGLEYAAIGLLVLGLVGAIVQQIFADWIRANLGRVWRRMSGRFRGIRRDEWSRYQAWVTRTYNAMKLGFLQDASITLNDMYVPLQYEQDGQRIDIYRDIQSRLRTVVVGAAGAGKSVLLRHSMLQWAKSPRQFDRVPVLIELARSNRRGRSIEQLIIEALGRKDNEEGTQKSHKRRARPLVANAEQVVTTALDSGRLCVFLDGLDEVLTSRRADVAQDIKEFAERHPTCQIVVTCRDAVYDNDLHPVFDKQIRVAGFDDAEIRQFLWLWFTRQAEPTSEDDDDGISADPREHVEQLMAALRANRELIRLARSPLMLTMITSLYEADPGSGAMLSSSRAEFYELAVTHLLRRDRDLGRHRDLARYQAGHKLMALRAIALAAQGAKAENSDHRMITEDVLYAEMSRLLPRFHLVYADLPKMANEIVDRSGLLLRIDDSNLLYEFAHLTLQEYLAAVELADAPDRLLALYRENPARWRETVKLWCAGANRDSTAIVQEIFAGVGWDRLLALECVAEARQIDDALATSIVDYFVAQLGTGMRDEHPVPEVPADPSHHFLQAVDKQLVLTVLGAVAGRPGPIGQRLFVRLKNEAMLYRPAGEDAITALGWSRRREAIETLSELAPRRPAARTALRSTGELAIPVLASRARGGSVEAIDDLAAIGTPAAAIAIAEQLWGERSVAIGAAWRLAALICAPDVESELIRFDPAPFQCKSEDWLDWLWAPFVPAPSRRTGMAVTMGRVGWLIDRSTEDDVPMGLGPIDTRLALGLGARPGCFLEGPLPAQLHHRIFEAIQQARHKEGDIYSYMTYYRAMAMPKLITVDPTVARQLAAEVITARAKTWLHGVLLRKLPTPVLFDLVERLWKPGNFHVDARDWLALNERSKRSKTLSFVRDTVSWTAGICWVGILSVALTWRIGAFIGWWAADPLWLATIVIASTIVFGVVAFFVASVPGENELLVAVFTVSATVAAVIIVIIAIPTMGAWLGWPMTITVVVMVAGVSIVSGWAAGRERALPNPYRELLKLDERSVHTSATVIAPSTRP